tara:strand:+ start:1099 stop:1698 length:600 start_codon:yes stop_codon:yes gene_type:complete
MACTALTKGRRLACDRISAGIKYVYFGVYDEFDSAAATGEVLGTGIVRSAGEITDIEMGDATGDLYRYALPRGESSLTETIVGSTEAGTIYYTPSISIKLNQLTTAMQNQVKLLATSKLIIFAQLNQQVSGKDVIIGMGVENGMRLNTGTNVSGGAWGDHNGYNWTFDGMEEEPMSTVAAYTAIPFDNTAFDINAIVIT